MTGHQIKKRKGKVLNGQSLWWISTKCFSFFSFPGPTQLNSVCGPESEKTEKVSSLTGGHWALTLDSSVTDHQSIGTYDWMLRFWMDHKTYVRPFSSIQSQRTNAYACYASIPVTHIKRKNKFRDGVQARKRPVLCVRAEGQPVDTAISSCLFSVLWWCGVHMVTGPALALTVPVT